MEEVDTSIEEYSDEEDLGSESIVDESTYISYADVRLARRIRPDIVEKGRDINSVLQQPPYMSPCLILSLVQYARQIVTPTGSTYTGVDFCPKLCGVSDTRRCESMGNACYKGIKIGKIKRHKGDKFVCGGASEIDYFGKELTNSKWRHTAEFRGAGLVNRHSHCYVNAVIQCLLHTAEFFRAIMSDTGSSLLCTCGDEPGKFCLLHCLRRLFNQLTSGDEVICPLELTENLDFFTPSSDDDEGSDEDNYDPRFYMNIEDEEISDPCFYMNIANDARRFLVCLIAKLKKCHDESAGLPLVNRLFQYKVKNKFKCIKCRLQASPTKRAFHFDVDYVFNDRKLEYALERLTFEQKKFCRRCGSRRARVESYYRTIYTHAPEIAIFVLDKIKNRGKKVLRRQRRRNRLSFPMLLDLTPFSTGKEFKGKEAKARKSEGEKERPLLYNLYAMIVHEHTSKDNGHFYVLARTHTDLWFEFDDTHVSRVEKEDVLEKKPYVLFYARKGSLWFSDAVLQHKRELLLREAGPSTDATLMQLQPPRRRRFPMWRPFSLFFRTLRRSQFRRRAR